MPETGDIFGATVSIQGNRTKYGAVYFEGKQIKISTFAVYAMTGKWPNGVVDHKNRDKFDDSWNNLRVITSRQNSRNRSKISNRKYIGVTYEKGAKWRYHFVIDGIRYRKAGYNCETKCALERDKHVLKLKEEFTTLNILERTA